jgi:hypothetical protein
MITKGRVFVLVAALAAMLMLTACPKQESISKIKQDPERYRNKEVAIVGTVTNSYGALGRGAYEVDDGTGRLWVVSRERGVPSRGARIGVKGKIHQGLTFGGQTFGIVMEESDRRVKDR